MAGCDGQQSVFLSFPATFPCFAVGVMDEFVRMGERCALRVEKEGKGKEREGLEDD